MGVSELYATGGKLPGYLVLGGGGKEVKGGWSDMPYKWGIDKSVNKKVAIISYSFSKSLYDLKSYFIGLGALHSEVFVVNTLEIANSPELYENILLYDFIFFTDGDAWEYYSTYKSTLLQHAVTEKFAQGGVIGGNGAGMQILSEVVFTSEKGTVYSEECLYDPFNQYVTLADNFLNLLPGYINDTRFVERNRFGRLSSFMKNWQTITGKDIKGLGVDDNTVICIDTSFKGIVFGTGAVSIYRMINSTLKENVQYSTSAATYDVCQVPGGNMVNLLNMEVAKSGVFILPPVLNETFPGYLLMSGSDDVNENRDMLQKLISIGNNNDSILIVTGREYSSASFFINTFLSLGFSNFSVMQAIPANENSFFWKSKVNSVPKVLFVGSDYYYIIDFFTQGDVGPELLALIKSGRKITAFAGSSSRFAGRTVVINYEEKAAAFNGLLETGPGLGILNSMVIIPNAFASDVIDVENTATAVPWVMTNDSITYGLWLSFNSFAEYSVVNSVTTIKAYGDYPVLMLHNYGTNVFSNSNNKGEVRQISGFAEMKLSLIDSNSFMPLGYIVEHSKQISISDIKVYPNPATDVINIEWAGNYPFTLSVINPEGYKIMERIVRDPFRINTQDFKKGVYYLFIGKDGYGNIIVKKFIVA